MEVPLSGDHRSQLPLPPPESRSSGRKKGGLRTMPFIIANESFDALASRGIHPNMMLYLTKDYRLSLLEASNILQYWNAVGSFLPVVGAIIADSYLGRFLTIAIGSLFVILGMILLWLTSMIPEARPPPCNLQSGHTCKSATSGQLAFLFTSFVVMSIGGGGIRPCSLAFGADQLDDKDNPNRERLLESYISWYYASGAAGILIAFTAIVYIQENKGWKVGYGIPPLIMIFSTLLFLIASPLYIKAKVKKNLILTSFAQVVVAATKNRKLPFPSQTSDGYFYHKESEYTVPSQRLRFLNKACIIKNVNDISPEGVALDSWTLCTVEQVEQLKRLLRIIPIWSSTVMLSLSVSQGSFPMIQSRSVDRHLTRSFVMPSAWLVIPTIITAMTWIFLYDRVLIPFASKIRGKPVKLGARLRMAIGLLISCGAMAVSAMVEDIRRRRAIEQGFINEPEAVIRMSVMWLVPQHCLIGLAEAFIGIGQSEFYYRELPKSMASIAGSLGGLHGAVANLLAAAFMNCVHRVTKGEGKESWVSTNINKGHFDYYYWLLVGMGLVNVLYFIFCCWLYGPGHVGDGVGDLAKVKDEGKYAGEE